MLCLLMKEVEKATEPILKNSESMSMIIDMNQCDYVQVCVTTLLVGVTNPLVHPPLILTGPPPQLYLWSLL